MLAKNDIIYSKYGDLATVEEILGDRITIILQRTQLFNEGGVLKRTPGKPERVTISESDFGITYFYEVEDIGDMEVLSNPSGAYAKNIQVIQEHYEKEVKDYADVLPAGERINEWKKQRIIDSYYDLEAEKKKESKFIGEHEACFGRFDLDVRYGVGHGIKYFQSRHHDKCYITKGVYHKLPDGTHIVNWRSDIADFYYSQDKTFFTSLNYLDVFDESRGQGVQGIDYDYTLMLKRSFATNPFSFRNLYIGGEHSTGEEGVNLYENGSIDPFLIQIIEEKRLENKLTDIIVSIQANQNEMIRHAYNKNMLVQGCAGSGKTMILLHRISYLKYNKYLRNFEKAVIIVPNKSFDLFIDELAENLEIEKMPRMTMLQYYLKLAMDYQSVLDRDFGGAAKSIEDQFLTLASSEFMGTNATSADEDFSDDYEYTLCDFYDASIKEYYKQIDLEGIISLADRFGITFDQEQPFYKQFNALYAIVSEKIWSIYNSMEADEKRKIQSIESEWKRYNELISRLKSLIDKLVPLDKAIDSDWTIKQIKELIEEKKQLAMSIAEKEALVEQLKKESENAPRGFLRLLSNASNISKEKLENEIRELDELKEKQRKIVVPESVEQLETEAIEQFDQIIEFVAKKQNMGSSFYRGTMEILSVLLDQINKGALNLRKGIAEIDSRCMEIEQSSEVQAAIAKYNDNKGDLEKVLALKPNEEESELLKNAENILRNRRMFITRIFKKLTGVDISEIDKGRQVFSLLALYCLHIGRSESDLEYIFIDEGQDYSESEYRILRAIHKDSCRFEVYGDVSQCVTPNRGLKSWDYLKTLFNADYYEMKENYRNTVEIAEYINKNVLDVFNTIGFRGPKVVEMKAPWNNCVMDAINHNNGKRIAVICHDKEKIDGMDDLTISFLSMNGFLYNVIDAKGLEFDVVFVIPRNMSTNEKYVALSRSLKELTVLM